MPTLAEIVTDKPAAARVFDLVGLDYCCGGEQALDDACHSAGLDVHAVTIAIDAAADPTDPGCWRTYGPAQLADHLEQTHHAFLHAELPALEALARKVRDVHRGRHPELDRVADLVAELGADLERHLLKEERVLFPAIRALADDERDVAPADVAEVVRALIAEHHDAGELFGALRSATRGYLVPDDACTSYRSLYDRLEGLEVDTHLHVLKENHLLFPAALALTDAEVTFDSGAVAARPSR